MLIIGVIQIKKKLCVLSSVSTVHCLSGGILYFEEFISGKAPALHYSIVEMNTITIKIKKIQ